MEGIKNFLSFINENWTYILAIIGLCIAIYAKVIDFINLSKEEKIEAAKKALDDVILDLISNAEFYWQNIAKSGQLKRSQVISKIYEMFPILKEYQDQEELIEHIDYLIDSYLPLLDSILEEAKEAQEPSDGPVEFNFSNDTLQMIDEVETNGIGESEQDS